MGLKIAFQTPDCGRFGMLEAVPLHYCCRITFFLIICDNNDKGRGYEATTYHYLLFGAGGVLGFGNGLKIYYDYGYPWLKLGYVRPHQRLSAEREVILRLKLNTTFTSDAQTGYCANL